MEGEQARLIGARGGTSTEKVCSREERKRRKKSGGVEEGPAGLQKHPDCSSASSISHGSHLWPIVTVLDYRLPAVKDEAEITWREMMVAEVFWMCALTPLFTRCCMVSAGMIYVQLCDDLIRFLQCSHEKGNAKELAPLSDYTFYRSWCQVSCLHLFQAGSCLKEAFFSNDNAKHVMLSVLISADDRSSASGLDVADRLTYLEQRMQMQEDEIQLLKMALADVLKRLNISEEHQAAASAAAGRRAPGAKGEQRRISGVSIHKVL